MLLDLTHRVYLKYLKKLIFYHNKYVMKLFTNIIKCKHSCVILSIFYIIFLEKLIFFIAFILLRKCYFKYNIYIPSRWQAGGRTSLVASDSRGQHLYPALCTSIPNYFSGIHTIYIHYSFWSF